jgi:hypothetical protein
VFSTVFVGLPCDSFSRIADSAIIKSTLLLIVERMLFAERLKNDLKLVFRFSRFYRKSLHHRNSRKSFIISQCQ